MQRDAARAGRTRARTHRAYAPPPLWLPRPCDVEYHPRAREQDDRGMLPEQYGRHRAQLPLAMSTVGTCEALWHTVVFKNCAAIQQDQGLQRR